MAQFQSTENQILLHLFVYVLSMATFLLPRQSWVAATIRVHKTKNIYRVALYRKGLLIPASDNQAY